MLVNGTTTGWLVKKLGLAGTSQIKQRVMVSFMEHFLEETDEYQKELQSDTYLQAADWGAVTEMVGRQQFQEIINQAKERLNNLEDEKKRTSMMRLKEIFKAKAPKEKKADIEME